MERDASDVVSCEYTLTVRVDQGSESVDILEHGAGGHRFVAWHGLNGVNRFWTWDCLRSEGRVILAGLPGHGPVPRYPPAHYLKWTSQHLIDVGTAVARRCFDGRPMTLIGHSAGGMVALGVALRAPELVGRLILLSPVVWSEGLEVFPRQVVRLSRRPFLTHVLLALGLGPVRSSYRLLRRGVRLLAGSGCRAPESAGFRRWGYADYRRTSFRALVGTLRAIRTADLRTQVRAAPPAVPTLLLHGDRDPLVPVRQSEWLASVLPCAELVVMEGAGHVIQFEREEALNGTVRAWCGRHPVD